MKNGALIAIIVGIAVLFVGGMYFQNQYDVFSIQTGKMTTMRPCSVVMQSYYGAGQGDCIFLNGNLGVNPNSVNLYKVISVSERSRPCTVSLACPTGEQLICDTDVSHNINDILTCTEAYSSVGHMTCDLGYCEYDSVTQIPDSCSSGDCLTISDTTHVSCLSNGKYSGILSGQCPGETCTPIWVCGSWSTCSGNTQTRTCTDSNDCNSLGKPSTSQSCTNPVPPTCTPNWQTGSWSACSNSLQTRTVTDSNNCQTTSGKPSTSQGCNGTTGNIFNDIFNDPMIWWIIGGIGTLLIVVLLLGKKK